MYGGSVVILWGNEATGKCQKVPESSKRNQKKTEEEVMLPFVTMKPERCDRSKMFRNQQAMVESSLTTCSISSFPSHICIGEFCFPNVLTRVVIKLDYWRKDCLFLELSRSVDDIIIWAVWKLLWHFGENEVFYFWSCINDIGQLEWDFKSWQWWDWMNEW